MADGWRSRPTPDRARPGSWRVRKPLRLRLKGSGPSRARIAAAGTPVRDPDTVRGRPLGGRGSAGPVYARLDAGPHGGLSQRMSHNTFGHLFRVTTWGESHGPAIGCVVDGCPPQHPADRGRSPAVAGPAQARRQPLRHPAAGERHGPHPVRRVRRRRRPGHHRHADLHPDRQRGRSGRRTMARSPAPSARPRRLRLSGQIRRARPSRWRPFLGARDGGARRRRSRGPQGAGRDHPHPRGRGPAGPAPDRARGRRFRRRL
jgi:hypothetical protein